MLEIGFLMLCNITLTADKLCLFLYVRITPILTCVSSAKQQNCLESTNFSVVRTAAVVGHRELVDIEMEMKKSLHFFAEILR